MIMRIKEREIEGEELKEEIVIFSMNLDDSRIDCDKFVI